MDFDLYSPNVRFRDSEYIFTENKIIKMLDDDNLSEHDFSILQLLANTNTPEYACVAKDLWGKITEVENFAEFDAIKSLLRYTINARFMDAEFTYKTPQGKLIKLSRKKTDKLSNTMREYLHRCSNNRGYFDQFDLIGFKEKNESDLRTYAPKWELASQAVCQQEQDAPYGRAMVGSWDSNDDYKRHKDAKNCLENDLFSISNTIKTMRFFSEFNNTQLFNEFESNLNKNLFTISVKTHGLHLFKLSAGKYREEEIQKELDRLIFQERDPKLLAHLINKGANVNAFNHCGMTALGMLFSMNPTNLSELATVLLDAGADINLGECSERKSTFMYIFSKDSRASVQVLERIARLASIERRQAALKVVCEAYGRPNEGHIKALLLAGASPSVKNFAGNTLLMHAAVKDCHTDTIELILGLEKAGVDTQNNDGNTALMLLLKKGVIYRSEMKIIDLLIAAGTNINLNNNNGENAIDLAKKLRHEVDREAMLGKLNQVPQ